MGMVAYTFLLLWHIIELISYSFLLPDHAWIFLLSYLLILSSAETCNFFYMLSLTSFSTSCVPLECFIFNFRVFLYIFGSFLLKKGTSHCISDLFSLILNPVLIRTLSGTWSKKVHLVYFLILAQLSDQKLKNGRIEAIWQKQSEEILLFSFLMTPSQLCKPLHLSYSCSCG